MSYFCCRKNKVIILAKNDTSLLKSTNIRRKWVHVIQRYREAALKTIGTDVTFGKDRFSLLRYNIITKHYVLNQ